MKIITIKISNEPDTVQGYMTVEQSHTLFGCALSAKAIQNLERVIDDAIAEAKNRAMLE